MISAEDRLRIHAAVRAELDDPRLAELVCKIAETVGLEKALRDFNLTLADPRVQSGKAPA
jgi:hypothetical protein